MLFIYRYVFIHIDMFFCCNVRKENNTAMDTAIYIVLVGWKIRDFVSNSEKYI